MGYTTDFRGAFELDKPLTVELKNFLEKLADTRRMNRNVKGYGVCGEFFVDGEDYRGQGMGGNVVNGNSPGSTQPSLWLQWVPNEDGTAIEWDGGEKFYQYTEWLIYIINKVLKPNGYVVNGTVEYRGEEWDDNGKIEVKDNVVYLNDVLQEVDPIIQDDVVYKAKDIKGIIYVKVALYLELDQTDEKIQEIVSDLDYEFKHDLISHTEIKEIID